MMKSRRWGMAAGGVCAVAIATTAIALPSAQAVDAKPRCQGKSATIVKGDGDNDIAGTPDNDVIVAGGGDDDIEASSGDDLICAGGGNDDVDGESGRDGIVAGKGRDHVLGGSDKDRIELGSGDDGGLAPFREGDFLGGADGGVQQDNIFGNSGDDVLEGDAGSDHLDGGKGIDECDEGVGGGDTVNCEGV